AAAPGAARDDDILALFGAADAAPIDAVVPEAPRDDDILAMFAVPPEPAPTEPKREGESKEPDILDLFGGRSTEPDTGKAP
ncbi:MAG: hypothetical protein ACXWIZ_17735, partial [Caldimonas sp.]